MMIYPCRVLYALNVNYTAHSSSLYPQFALELVFPIPDTIIKFTLQDFETFLKFSIVLVSYCPYPSCSGVFNGSDDKCIFICKP